MKIFLQILFLVLAYLIGSIPWGFLMGKMKGIDIRKHGSKNIGATNTGRLLGTKYAIYAYILDTIKGALFVGLFNFNILSNEYCLLSPMLYGLVAALGHTFPIYLGFKGGKAVATGGGIILGYSPLLFVILIAIFFLVTYISRYVSLGSLVTATCTVIISVVLTAINNGFSDLSQKYNIYFPIGVVIIFIIILIRHKSNIKRIIHREEAKVKWRK
ncbi:MAG TPA: glycerol-3-phosphate 1-O-acyltransferase PlsY [Acholeplasmataceae bacterium]|nr:glycerol-3-phosphate 1-O-acyltransferase PlsY [Acholeplasmataceae bacterium]